MPTPPFNKRFLMTLAPKPLNRFRQPFLVVVWLGSNLLAASLAHAQSLPTGRAPALGW